MASIKIFLAVKRLEKFALAVTAIRRAQGRPYYAMRHWGIQIGEGGPIYELHAAKEERKSRKTLTWRRVICNDPTKYGWKLEEIGSTDLSVDEINQKADRAIRYMINERRHYRPRKNNCHHFATYLEEDIIQNSNATLALRIEKGTYTRRTYSISRKKRRALSKRNIYFHRSATVYLDGKALQVSSHTNRRQQNGTISNKSLSKSRSRRNQQTTSESSSGSPKTDNAKEAFKDSSQPARIKQQPQTKAAPNERFKNSYNHRKRRTTSTSSLSPKKDNFRHPLKDSSQLASIKHQPQNTAIPNKARANKSYNHRKRSTTSNSSRPLKDHSQSIYRSHRQGGKKL